MGLVIVVVDASLGGFDAVPDVLGWLLALAGLRDLRGVLDGPPMVTALAVVSALVSVVLLLPSVGHGLDTSTGWFLSLPQLAFSLLLCQAMARQAHRRGARSGLRRRFWVLGWVFAAVALAPTVIYGAGVDRLLVPVALSTVGANVYLVYLLFRHAGLARPEPEPAP